MGRYKIAESHNEYNADITFHPDILDILFQDKASVSRKLLDVKGSFLIDHIAIKIIDPNNEMVVFSITPSVEYNLIVQGLWKYDNSFSVSFQEKNFFYPWENAYSQNYFDTLKQIKELKHGFTFGFSISKKIDRFNLIYSYATRSKNTGLINYYQAHINELINIGDYGYKLIHNTYLDYCNIIFKAPTIDGTQHYHRNPKPFLTLIVNNN